MNRNQQTINNRNSFNNKEKLLKISF